MRPIIAISTSNLNSAIGIIRISFGRFFFDLDLFFLKIFKKKLKPRYATFVNFYYKKKIIDNGIAIFFLHPNSYTGEDVLEFHGHGNYYNLNYLLKIFLFIFKKNKIRIANKGEFTKRAFLNKKINLFEVQNLSNLINTNNNYSLKFIHDNFTNNLYFKLNLLFDIFLNLENYIKYNLYNNFFIKENIIKYKLHYLYKKIFEIYKNIKINNFINNFSIILLGSPNSGKSTIINKLLNKNTLIVSSLPGTTRDLVNRYFFIDDFKFNIYDTAGLRFTINKLEKKGIKFAFNQLKKSNIVLYIFDKKFKINFFLKKILNLINNLNIFLFIFNKIDLIDNIITLEIFIVFGIKNIIINISAKFNLGINFIYIELGRLSLNFKFNFDIFYINYMNKIIKILKNLLLNYNNNSFEKKNFLIKNIIFYFKKILFFKKKKINSLFKNFCIGK